MFTLPEASGSLLGGELKIVTVILKASPQPITVQDIQSAKFKVSLVPAGDEYSFLGPKEFWSKYAELVIDKLVISDLAK